MRYAMTGDLKVERGRMTGLNDSQVLWRKCIVCAGGECLEVAILGERVLLRSSRDPGLQLRLTHAEWREFVVGVRDGEFDADV